MMLSVDLDWDDHFMERVLMMFQQLTWTTRFWTCTRLWGNMQNEQYSLFIASAFDESLVLT